MVQHRLPMLPSAGEVSWAASINGVKKQLNIENNAILLDVLRDKAGSLAPKGAVTWAHVAVVLY